MRPWLYINTAWSLLTGWYIWYRPLYRRRGWRRGRGTPPWLRTSQLSYCSSTATNAFTTLYLSPQVNHCSVYSYFSSEPILHFDNNKNKSLRNSWDFTKLVNCSFSSCSNYCCEERNSSVLQGRHKARRGQTHVFRPSHPPTVQLWRHFRWQLWRHYLWQLWRHFRWQLLRHFRWQLWRHFRRWASFPWADQPTAPGVPCPGGQEPPPASRYPTRLFVYFSAEGKENIQWRIQSKNSMRLKTVCENGFSSILPRTVTVPSIHVHY